MDRIKPAFSVYNDIKGQSAENCDVLMPFEI